MSRAAEFGGGENMDKDMDILGEGRNVQQNGGKGGSLLQLAVPPGPPPRPFRVGKTRRPCAWRHGFDELDHAPLRVKGPIGMETLRIDCLLTPSIQNSILA